MMNLKIAHLYPDILAYYGDAGNITVLEKRCSWRKINCSIARISLNDDFDDGLYDIVYMGGMLDFSNSQRLMLQDLQKQKAKSLERVIENNRVLLAVGGGYQLLGHYYEPLNKDRISCLGLLDFYTKEEEKRFTGEILTYGNNLLRLADKKLIGFENHRGRTYLGENIQAFAEVITGSGNNGQDKTEGIVHKNTIGTYMQGATLAQNPALADWMLLKALQRKGYQGIELEPLDDGLINEVRKQRLQLA